MKKKLRVRQGDEVVIQGCPDTQYNMKVHILPIDYSVKLHMLGPFKCDICDKELKSERTLKVDITNLHMKQATPHPCDICPKTFPLEPDCANTRTTPTNLQNLPVMSVTSDQPESGTH